MWITWSSYSISGIQDYFDYIIKKHDTLTDDTWMQIYVNRIGNTLTFKIRTGYYFELLTLEIIKSKKKAKDENSEKVTHL